MTDSNDYYYPSTYCYLDSLDDQIEFIDLSKSFFEGVLDLNKFTKLKKLNCNDNEFTKIIGLSNTICEINCSNNKIEHIDLSNGINLETLNINNNKLKQIDLRKTINLKNLNITGNQIGYLDLSATIIDFPQCAFNQIVKLIPPLVPCEISCEHNKLKSIDNFTDNVFYINCSDNQISHINKLPDNLVGIILDNNKIIKLPESYPPNIKSLGLVNCNITLIDNLPKSLEVCYFSKNPISNNQEIRSKFNWIRFY